MRRTHVEEIIAGLHIIGCILCFHWGYMIVGWVLLARAITDEIGAIYYAIEDNRKAREETASGRSPDAGS